MLNTRAAEFKLCSNLKSRRSSPILIELPVGTALQLNLAAVFNYPLDGRMAEDFVFQLLDRILQHRTRLEICLRDTTGQL